MTQTDEIRIGEKRFSRGEIARGTGLSLSHVSRVFSGRRNPSIAAAKRIAEFCSVTVNDVITYLDVPSTPTD